MIRVVAFVVLDGGNIAELFVAEVVGMAVIEIALFEEGGCFEPNGIQNSCNKNYNQNNNINIFFRIFDKGNN